MTRILTMAMLAGSVIGLTGSVQPHVEVHLAAERISLEELARVLPPLRGLELPPALRITNFDAVGPLHHITITFAAQSESGAVRGRVVLDASAPTRAARGTIEVRALELADLPAAESERVAEVLTTKGADAALETLRSMKPVGRISTPGNLAYNLHYAYQEPMPDGGRRIFLATDRPISFWEAVNQPRVSNYPFTFIELQMNGKGQG